MATLFELNRRSIKIDPIKIYSKAISINSSNIIKSLQDQLYKGKTAGFEGRELSFNYSKRTKQALRYSIMKNKMNPGANRKVDFYLTGAFYRGMTLIKENDNEFFINSTDEKTDLLKDRFGNNIMGLTKNTYALVTEKYILLSMQMELRNILGL